MSTTQNSFTCPTCGMTSYHPMDVINRYCGNCHTWPELRESVTDDFNHGRIPQKAFDRFEKVVGEDAAAYESARDQS